MPAFTACTTRGASGFKSSSDGPIFPVAPASASVWQIAQDGVASFKNTWRPASSVAPALAMTHTINAAQVKSLIAPNV